MGKMLPEAPLTTCGEMLLWLCHENFYSRCRAVPGNKPLCGLYSWFPRRSFASGNVGRVKWKFARSRGNVVGRRRAKVGGGICRHSDCQYRLIMGNVPVLKPREVSRILNNLGFQEVRQRGSHRQFRHPDGRSTTVPFHSGRDISPFLLRQIAKDVGMRVEDFIGHR